MRSGLTDRRAAVLAAALLAAAPALAEDGEALFEIHCAACHNTGGTGNPGLAPPLDRPAFWQGLGEAAPEYLAGVMVSGLNGTLVVEGQTYAGLIMPPVAGTTDEELAEIGTWVLGTLGETGSALGVEEIAAARETRPSHADLRAMRPAE